MVLGSILGSGTFFHWVWSWNHFNGHSIPTAVSCRAVVSYWRKDVHLVLVNRFGSLPRNSWLTVAPMCLRPGYLKTHIIIRSASLTSTCPLQSYFFPLLYVLFHKPACKLWGSILFWSWSVSLSVCPSVTFLFRLNVLGKLWWILTKFCICIHIDNI